MITTELSKVPVNSPEDETIVPELEEVKDEVSRISVEQSWCEGECEDYSILQDAQMSELDKMQSIDE